MKKRKVSRLLAVMLAVTMAINPITAGAAVDSDLELFQDGPTAESNETEFEMFDDAEEIPLFDDGEAAVAAETVEFADAAVGAATEGEDPWANAVEVFLNTNTLEKQEGSNQIFCRFVPGETGCYEIEMVWDNNEKSMLTQTRDVGVPILFDCSSLNGTSVTVRIRKIKRITALSTDLSGLTGYIELGGGNLQEYLKDVNPVVTATVEDGSTVQGNFKGGLPGYGDFVVRMRDDQNPSMLTQGVYSFDIVSSADYTIATEQITYTLISLNNSDVAIPKMDGSTTSLSKNCTPYYVGVLDAGDEEKTFTMQFDEWMNVRTYNESGELTNDRGGQTVGIMVPQGKRWYVRIAPDGNNNTPSPDFINVTVKVTETPKITEEGTHELLLVDGDVKYTFTPPEDGTYEFTTDLRSNTKLYLNGQCLAESYAVVYKLEKGKIYTLEAYCWGTDPNPETVNVTIKKIPAIEKIEVIDSSREQMWLTECKNNSDFNESWEQGLNVRLKITFDDGRSAEKLYGNGDINMQEYGFISAQLLDEAGNRVPYNDPVTEGTYDIQFCWSKNEEVVSDRNILCEVKSVENMNLSVLEKDTPVSVGRDYKDWFMAKFSATEEAPTAYMITEENDSDWPADVLGIYYVEDGIFKRASDKAIFVAEPDRTYYMLSECKEANTATKKFILKKKGATVTGFTPVNSNPEKKPFFEEFGASESDFDDWEFLISYSDDTTETLKNHEWSKFGSFWCRVESWNKKVRFYLGDDPEKEKEGHFYETTYLLKSITEATEEEIADVTGVLDTEEKITLSEYQNLKGYFKFTAPETGIYSFTTYGADRFMYYLNGSLKDREEYIRMEAGQTLYGCAFMYQGAETGISVRTVDESELPPKVTSIKVQDDYYTNTNIPFGVYFANDTFWQKLPLVIAYDDGTTEELRINPWKYSQYYGRANVEENYEESDAGDFGIKKITFGLEDWQEGRSDEYDFHIVDERTEELPLITGAGTYDLEYKYGDYACYVFKPSVTGTYCFRVNNDGGYLQRGECIRTYPRNFRNVSEDRDILEKEIQDRNYVWTEEIRAGEEICIAVSLMDKKPCSLSVEQVGTFESFEFTNLPKKFIKELGNSLYDRLKVKLLFDDGAAEEFVYGERDSAYFGSMYAGCDWENKKVKAEFEDYPEIKTEQTVDVYSLSEAEAEIPKITALGTDYVIPENYGFSNCYSFTAPKKGGFAISVKDGNGKDISGEIDRSMMHLGDAWAFRANASAPVTLEQGETVYIADCYNGQDITINIEESASITKIEFAAGTEEKIGRAYSWELLQKFDEELNERFFADCKFIITSEDNNGKIETETIGYGERPQKISGYGELRVNWPWDMVGDWIPVGYNQTASFAVSGSSVGCPFPVDILKNGNGDLHIPEIREGQETKLETTGANGNAKNFQYSNSEAAVYKITFMNQPKLRAAFAPMAKAAAESKTDSVYIQVGDSTDVHKYDNIQQDSVIYLETDKTFTGAFYGECDSIKIEKVDKNSLAKLLAKKNEKAKALYGDMKYSFADWNFTLDEEPLVYAGNLKHWKAGDQAKTAIDFAKEKGTFDIVFALIQTDSIISDRCELEIVSADALGIDKMTVGTEYSFSKTSVYDGNQAAYMDVKEDGYYDYKVAWNGAKSGLEMLSGYNGTCSGISRDSGRVYLNAGLYTLINRGGNVETVTIKKSDDEADKTVLTEYVIDCEQNLVKGTYTTASWNAYQNALNAAKTVLANTEAVQAEIDAALAALKAGVAGLVKDTWTPPVNPPVTPSPSPAPTPVPPTAEEKETLEKLYEDAKELKEEDYTKSTWEALEQAMKQAKEALESNDQSLVKEAQEALDAAVAGLSRMEIPVIKKVYVTGNKVTVALKQECENADGYDFVIDKDIDCIKTRQYADVSKNNTDINGEFSYVKRGYYYAYCHAYKLVNGKKIYFTPWSKAYKFKVKAITPTTPKILKVSVKGKTVTVTLSKSKNALGYDAILGKKLSKNKYETRPVDYGKFVKKNQKTTTIVFKNVPKGTYYVGAHAFNRTAGDSSKVFGNWTVPKKIKVK